MPVPTLRLFFALWPDAATRTIIGELARQVAAESHGRAVASDNIHVTLAFLGTQPVASVPELRSLAAARLEDPGMTMRYTRWRCAVREYGRRAAAELEPQSVK